MVARICRGDNVDRIYPIKRSPRSFRLLPVLGQEAVVFNTMARRWTRKIGHLLRRATHGAAASDPIRGSHYATAQAIAVSGRTAPNDGSKLRYFVDGEFGDISKTDEQSSLGYAWATEEGDVLQQHCSGLSQVSKFSCPPRSQGDKTSDSISSHTSEPPWRKNLTRSVNHASFSSGVSWSGE